MTADPLDRLAEEQFDKMYFHVAPDNGGVWCGCCGKGGEKWDEVQHLQLCKGRITTLRAVLKPLEPVMRTVSEAEDQDIKSHDSLIFYVSWLGNEYDDMLKKLEAVGGDQPDAA